MQKIDLIPGTEENAGEAAFSLDKMQEQQVDSYSLSAAMQQQLAGFAMLLSEGCGVAVVLEGGEAAVIGVKL